MPRVIVFDVNETLLDLQALDPHFQRIFGDTGARKEWFAQVLLSAMVATLTGAYSDFGVIARSSLDMVALRRAIALTEEDRATIFAGMRSLPPHPDVIPSLERLRKAGLRLATLTNSPPVVLHDQLNNAGLRDYFEAALSVDAVRRLKPAPEVYHMAAEQLGIARGQLRLVAAHDWDVTGAIRAGCTGAFISRPGMVLGPLSEVPDIVGPDLHAVTDRILDIELGG